MVPLKSIKAGSKKLISVKLFFIAKSRRILKIGRPRLIRIYYRYKSSLVLSSVVFDHAISEHKISFI